MNTVEYIARAKASLGITSDYALAAHLGITRSYMSALSTGKQAMSNQLAREFARIIDLPAGSVVLDAEIERAKDDDTRNIWKEIKEGFPTPLPHANRARGASLTR